MSKMDTKLMEIERRKIKNMQGRANNLSRWHKIPHKKRLQMSIDSGNENLITVTDFIILYGDKPFRAKQLWTNYKRKNHINKNHIRSQMNHYTSVMTMLTNAGILYKDSSFNTNRYKLLVPMDKIKEINDATRRNGEMGSKAVRFGANTNSDKEKL